MRRTCQARYGGDDCERPAVWIYHGFDRLVVLCDECADRLCTTPDWPYIGEAMRARLTRLKEGE